MKKNLLLALSLVTLGACKSGPQPVAEVPKIPDGAKNFPVKQITTVGESDRAVYSFDGSSIFFVSAGRTGHTQWQAYQYFVANQRERRLTFQDGEVESIIPGHKANEIFYASSTDEIKEIPDFIRKATQKDTIPLTNFFGNPLPRAEIYSSDINGDKISRVTKSPGFDGDLALRRLKNEFAFVSARGGNLDIYTVVSGNLNRVTTSKDADFSPALSEKGELVFVRGTSPIAHIYVANTAISKAVAITTETVAHLYPQWHPKAPWIVFTMNHPDPQNFEIYWMRKDGKCLERLTYSAENERSPTFSPDGTNLVFTREIGGQRQLFMMSELQPPVCADEVAPTPVAR
jgi:Tol biopolymer transport system component